MAETWRNLLKKITRCLDEVFSPLEQGGKPRSWGVRGGIEVMMESRRNVGLLSDPAQIARLYGADPGAASAQYLGREMNFRGAVVSCARTFDNGIGLWAVRINAGNIDAVGYLQSIIPVGHEIVMHGTCAGLFTERGGAKVTVALNPARVT